VNRTISGLFWIGLYLLVVLVPVLLMLLPPLPSGRHFWLELAVALGFVGLTQIALQFVLIARFRRVTAPYGIDIILRYHRTIALLAVALVLLHPVVLLADNPSRLVLLDPLGGNLASRFALASVAALLLLAASSVWRRQLGLRYERWRGAHLALGVVAIVCAQAHVSLAGLYVNTLWKHLLWIGTAALMVGLALWLRLVKPAVQRTARWRVAEVRPEPGDTHTLVLESEGHDGMRFAPGQFAWIKLGPSPYTLDEHPYSFASSAERPGRVAFGIKALGDFSAAVGEVPVGTRAYLDGPHGAFSLDRYPAVGYVFVAGGVGITPFLSFLRTMEDRGDPRPATLFYADKTWDAVAYREELARLGEKLALDVVYVLQDPPPEWDGERGVIDGALLDRHLPHEGFRRAFFVCGPPAMMDAVHAALRERGVPERDIQLERFDLA
jgi:predicted ferric reductase